MPSIVPNARKTKVNFGGKRKGRSACVAKRSWPSLARRSRRSRFCSSALISFSHCGFAPFLPSVASNWLSMFFAIRSIEKRSRPARSTPIVSSASTASIGRFLYVAYVRSTKPFLTLGSTSSIIP